MFGDEVLQIDGGGTYACFLSALLQGRVSLLDPAIRVALLMQGSTALHPEYDGSGRGLREYDGKGYRREPLLNATVDDNGHYHADNVVWYGLERATRRLRGIMIVLELPDGDLPICYHRVKPKWAAENIHVAWDGAGILVVR